MIKVKMITEAGVRNDIFPDGTTIREVYDKFGVNYNHTTNTANSNAIHLEEIDLPLSRFENDGEVRLSSVVKNDGGVEAIIAGPSLFVKSSVKLDDWKKVLKFDKDFGLSDTETDELVFKVSVQPGAGEIGKYGVAFSDTPTEEGYACVNVGQDMVENKKEYVEDTYGQAIMDLATLEECVPDVLKEAEEAREKISSKIKML